MDWCEEGELFGLKRDKEEEEEMGLEDEVKRRKMEKNRVKRRARRNRIGTEHREEFVFRAISVFIITGFSFSSELILRVKYNRKKEEGILEHENFT